MIYMLQDVNSNSLWYHDLSVRSCSRVPMNHMMVSPMNHMMVSYRHAKFHRARARVVKTCYGLVSNDHHYNRPSYN